jgi:hypothetical protein
MSIIKTELHIKNELGQLIEVIILDGNYKFYNENKLSDIYITLLYYLETPINEIISHHLFEISDTDIINNNSLYSLIKGIALLGKFKDFINYNIEINYITR